MLQMRDSTPALTDTATLLREIRSEGYVLLRALIDPAAATQVADDVRSVLANHGWIAHGVSERVRAVPPRSSDEYWRTLGDILALESLNALAHVDSLTATMRRLLGDGAYVYPMKTPRTVYPSALGGRPIDIHRDNRGGPWVRDMLTTWVALRDIPVEMGGLAMLPGSQTYEPAPDGSVEHSERLHVWNDDPRWVTTDFQPGDVVVFHCYAIHKGMPNETDDVRLSVDYRWQTRDHPAHVSVVYPYHYFDVHPRIPSWEELSTGWTTRRWCELPEDAPVTYTKWPYGDDDRVPASRFVDVAPGARGGWRDETRDDAPYLIATPRHAD